MGGKTSGSLSMLVLKGPAEENFIGLKEMEKKKRQRSHKKDNLLKKKKVNKVINHLYDNKNILLMCVCVCVCYLMGVRGLLLCLRTGRVRGSNEKPSFRLSRTDGAT